MVLVAFMGVFLGGYLVAGVEVGEPAVEGWD
jgi:hypothetical protein